jgi:hypothetical protein
MSKKFIVSELLLKRNRPKVLTDITAADYNTGTRAYRNFVERKPMSAVSKTPISAPRRPSNY